MAKYKVDKDVHPPNRTPQDAKVPDLNKMDGGDSFLIPYEDVAGDSTFITRLSIAAQETGVEIDYDQVAGENGWRIWVTKANKK